jgi:16S rRNA C967 or C1407 C5-methylase (RsmB/RsmF family)
MSEAFDAFYRERYGDSWDALRNSLLQKGRRICRPVAGTSLTSPEKACLRRHGYDLEHPEVMEIYSRNTGSFYVMDRASAWVAEQIPLGAGSSVWDACAAPGGKSLILLERLGTEGKLTATDLSKTRCFKMKGVFHHYFDRIPDQVSITQSDALRWGYMKQECYDAVLLDAPCSSERHVLQDAAALAQWTVARTKALAKRQYGLLCSAVLAAKRGGYVGYATCSINEMENDGVIERYLKRKGNVEVAQTSLPVGMPTRLGWMIRPDIHDDWGPIYFCLLRKL